jgi:hypothetical protein
MYWHKNLFFFIAGLLVMVLMIPLNGVVAQKMKKYQVTNCLKRSYVLRNISFIYKTI